MSNPVEGGTVYPPYRVPCQEYFCNSSYWYNFSYWAWNTFFEQFCKCFLLIG